MKKVLDFLIKMFYINIGNRIAFFYLVLIFIEAVYSENCSNAVLLPQKILPFYFKESRMKKLCKCGCKQEIRIRYQHKYDGIPNYIHGHNRRKEWLFYVEKLCGCSCGELVKHPEKGCKYIKGHNKRKPDKKYIDETKNKTPKYCKCGCGKTIVIKHWYKWRGIPDYIGGHQRRNKNHSEETKKKMSAAKIGKPSWNKDIPCSNETKKKLSIINTNKHPSEETKRKTSKSMMGKNKGKRRTLADRKKLSNAHRDIKRTKESKLKQSITMKKLFLSGKWIPKISYKFKNTSIEIAMEKQLKLNNINYEKQKYIKNVGFVDFFLTEYDIIIECDGNYWHNKEGAQQKDISRDFAAMFFHKYQTIRFWEHEINEDIGGV